jgi:hypothetical protein
MGIVAYCPNQHRVKVKDDLAGRKGVCPTCGARFRIPLASQPEPTLPVPAPAAAPAGRAPSAPAAPAPAAPAPAPVATSATGLPVAEIISFDADLAATLPRALPLATPEQGRG